MPDDPSKADGSTASDLSPSEFSTRGIPTVRRGYEKKAVDALVAAGVARWSELHRLHTELVDEVSSMGGVDYLARDLGAVGSEVGRVLVAAEQAASGLRDRAREHAARVHAESKAAADARLTEASDEADRISSEAEDQAVEVRRRAWEEGTRLVLSAAEQAASLLEEARAEVLRIRAEGEREAHRRMASTRKEAEDIMRAARFEADRQLDMARGLAADIVEEGAATGDHDRVKSAQDAIAAIDQARMARPIEGVAVLPAEPAPPLGAVPYEPRRQGTDAGTDLSDTLAAEVERLKETSHAAPSSGPAHSRPGRDFTEIRTLFEALRSTEGREAAVAARRDAPSGPIDLRDRAVLGLHNAGLREVKRRIADLQEQALSDLRGQGWKPSGASFAAELAPLLEPLIAKAAAAGAEAARYTVGVDARPVPGTRHAALAGSMTNDLEAQLESALAAPTGGPEETASSVSRVFRAWRTDEAERWVRTIVNAAYHDAMLASLAGGGFTLVRGVPSGIPCKGCPGAAGEEWDVADPPSAGIPPINLDCRCSFEPVKG